MLIESQRGLKIGELEHRAESVTVSASEQPDTFNSKACASVMIAVTMAAASESGFDFTHERLVSLQSVDRRVFRTVKRRMPGGEIVD